MRQIDGILHLKSTIPIGIRNLLYLYHGHIQRSGSYPTIKYTVHYTLRSTFALYLRIYVCLLCLRRTGSAQLTRCTYSSALELKRFSPPPSTMFTWPPRFCARTRTSVYYTLYTYTFSSNASLIRIRAHA